jgi:hypothetical protein
MNRCWFNLFQSIQEIHHYDKSPATVPGARSFNVRATGSRLNDVDQFEEAWIGFWPIAGDGCS